MPSCYIRCLCHVNLITHVFHVHIFFAFETCFTPQWYAIRLALISASHKSTNTCSHSSPAPPTNVMRVNLPFSIFEGSTGQSPESNRGNNSLWGCLCTRWLNLPRCPSQRAQLAIDAALVSHAQKAYPNLPRIPIQHLAAVSQGLVWK